MPSKEQEIVYQVVCFWQDQQPSSCQCLKMYPGTFKIQRREHFSLKWWTEPWNKLEVHWSILDSFESRSETLLENMS